MKLEEIGSRAKEVSRVLNNLGSTPRNEGLKAVAQALLDGKIRFWRPIKRMCRRRLQRA